MMTMIVRLVFAASLLQPAAAVGAGRSGATGMSACPAEVVQARANLNLYLTSPEFASERQRIGIADITPADVRLLTDATVCAQLEAMFLPGRYGQSPYRRTYYKSGSFYLATITQDTETSGKMVIGQAPFAIVFNSSLYPLNL